MEIKLNAGDKIQIPTGCKATIEDDLIIIEEKQEEKQGEFKDGDILLSKRTDNVVISKSYEDEECDTFCSHYNSANRTNDHWDARSFYHATEEEKQRLFDALKAKGLRWNAETKTMERIRKRAKWGETYYYISSNCKVYETTEAGLPFEDENYNIGNYYLPEEREQAEEDAKAVRAIFEKRLKV